MSDDSHAKHATFPRWRVGLSLVWLLTITTVGLIFTGFWHAGAFTEMEVFRLPHEDHWQVFEPDGYGCTVELPRLEHEVEICTFDGFPT